MLSDCDSAMDHLREERDDVFYFHTSPHGRTLRTPIRLVLSSSDGVYDEDRMIRGMSKKELLGCKHIRRHGRHELVFIGFRNSIRAGCFHRNHDLVREELSIAVDSGDETTDELIAEKWRAACKWMLSDRDALIPSQVLENQDDIPLPQPRRLLVLVNPAAGKRRGEHIWANVGAPLIRDDAECSVEVYHTKAPKDAEKYVQQLDKIAGTYTDLVIVSGDGLLFEVLQGVMARSDWFEVIQNIKFGIINAGTGNGLAKSLTDRSDLPCTVTSTAFLVGKGWSRALDVMAVDVLDKDRTTVKHRIYSFLTLSWGLVADIDIESEVLRCLGEDRLTLWGVLRMLTNRRYNGTLSFLPLQEDEQESLPMYWDKHKDLQHAQAPVTELLTSIQEDLPQNWITITDKFVGIWNMNVPWPSETTLSAPDINIDDGYIQVSYIRKHGPVRLTRWRIASYLLSLDTGASNDQPIVENARTRAFRFEPDLNSRRSHIDIDGEVIEYTPVQFENLHGFLSVLSL